MNYLDLLLSDGLNELMKPYYDNNNNIQYNIENVDDGILLKLNVAGYEKNELDIEIIDKLLVITGDNKKMTQEYQWNSIFSGKFTKKFKFNKKYDIDQIESNLLNGILNIKLPLKKSEKPKKVDIN